MKIITVSGKAGHGKDTFAAYLKAAFEHRLSSAEIFRFADELKNEAHNILGWNGLKDKEGRTLLQKHGEDRRKQDPYYWCKKLIPYIERSNSDIVIISDARYKNELEFLREEFTPEVSIYNVKVIRFKDGLIYDNGLTEEQRNHSSETSLDDYLFHIKVKYDEGLENVKELSNQVVEYILLGG